jgi:hypothetical protein
MPFTSSLYPKTSRFRAAFVLAVACVVLAALCMSRAFPTRGRAEARRVTEGGAARPPRVLESYGRLPLRFEANRGQAGGGVKFLARGVGYMLFLSNRGATLCLRNAGPKDNAEMSARTANDYSTLRVMLEGSNRSPKVSGLEEMQGRSNYLVGRDPRRWRTGVPVYAKVAYESVYPGIDMVYYGNEGRLEYDFRIAPGADAGRVRLRFAGARSTRVDENGDLVIATGGGDVRQQKPLAYQEVEGARREVAARYAKDARGAVRVELGNYDRTLPLVIDPVLVYSSYIGGNYTITPSKTNVSFEPPSRSFNSLGADQTADIVGADCTWTLSPARASFGAAGGTGTVNVTTLHGCPWTVESSAGWLTITSGGAGTDTGVVAFSVAPTNAPRFAHLTIAGRSFAVYQEFESCGAPDFSASTYNVFTFPGLVRVGDLNGDGRPDLVAGIAGGISGGGLQYTVLLNDGSGRFTTKDFEIGLGVPLGFDLADFNGDGRPDIVISDFASSFVRIFFNDGAGGFGLQSFKDVQLSASGQPRTSGGVRAADLNRDGKADFIAAAEGGPHVLVGDGAGNFTPLGPVTAGSFDAWIEVGDLNADGAPDLIFSGTATNNAHVAVTLNDGTGHFGTPVNSSLDGPFNFAGVGDFDGDGRADLAVMATVEDPASTPSNPILFNAVIILAGDGAGRFTQKSSTEAGRNGATRIAVADFNNDAKLDVAFGALQTTVMLGDGAGGVAQVIKSDPAVGSPAAADLDGDSRPDLAGVTSSGVTVLKNNCAAAPHISGRILEGGGRGLGGVTVTLSGAQSATMQTDGGGNYFFGGLTAGANYVVMPSKENYRFAPSNASVNNLSGGQTVDFAATAMTVRLAQNHYLVDENLNSSIRVDVTRGGDTSGAATVNYSTGGTNATTPASDRSDYTYAAGTLRFAPGETTKSFTVLLNDDALVEGFEGFNVNLSSPSGAILIAPSSALVEIRDNDFAPSSSNPISDSQFFVRRHYHDFLNREPDAAGLAFWTNEIEKCGQDAQCREVRRINVSGAFFLSIEFQETGYLVHRFYKAAYGDSTSPGVPGTVPVVRLQDFLPDTQQIGAGVQVGIGDWQALLEANKQDFALDFVQRTRFTSAFPSGMTAGEFVDRIAQNAGLTLTQSERDQMVSALGSTPSDASKRAQVLRTVAEDSRLRQAEFNRAFVLMEFYGYTRRNPDDPQDTDFRGWKFWLDKLNQFGGNFVQAEMVKAFISSDEYRHRFGQ